ncbi:hypothetical protein BC826DRAFT_158890 [Russula brevipes]|nr:hypothetical protein BC826DRAFT_158890 [Russula brevipes]
MERARADWKEDEKARRSHACVPEEVAEEHHDYMRFRLSVPDLPLILSIRRLGRAHLIYCRDVPVIFLAMTHRGRSQSSAGLRPGIRNLLKQVVMPMTVALTRICFQLRFNGERSGTGNWTGVAEVRKRKGEKRKGGEDAKKCIDNQHELVLCRGSSAGRATD